MRIGILADIHEAYEQLRSAIARLRAEEVQRFVVLGDIFENGRHIAPTVELLTHIEVVGVFGNHELGLALDPDESHQQKYGRRIVEFFRNLGARYETADCLFTHVQAWMDLQDIEQPWYWHDIPDTANSIDRNFAATRQRILFQGHYHRWLAATPEGLMRWQGETPLHLVNGCRYLIVVHAVCDGWCAVYDTETANLQPVRI